MPTENELPAMPKKNAHTISSPNVVARATSSVGIGGRQQQQRHQAPPADPIGQDAERQPPDRSAEDGDRGQPGELHRVEVQLWRIGTPSTPNISQTANSRVKAMVERVRTRVAGCIL